MFHKHPLIFFDVIIPCIRVNQGTLKKKNHILLVKCSVNVFCTYRKFMVVIVIAKLSTHECVDSPFFMKYTCHSIERSLPLSDGNKDFKVFLAFLMLSVLVTSSVITFTLFEQDCLRSSPPFSVKQPANTENPMESSLLANMFPNPVSHPVIIT